MEKLSKLVGLTLVLFICIPVSGQILDDSTQLIYGVHTTNYVTEQDIYNDVPQLRTLDTTFNSLHNFHLLYQGNSVFQNLGNFGTPLGNMYFNPVQDIGRSFGFNAFDSYAFDPRKVRYFDTRSPYSNITYRQSATGIQFGEALYTRNIRPNWNAGFHVRRFTVNKTIGVVTRSDKQADHTSFLFFNRFFTRDSVYQVLANFSVMDHQNFETGGVVRDSTETLEDVFDFQAEDIRFLNARGLDKRLAFHLYQEFKPSGPFQLFHEFDWRSQSNRFSNPVSADTGYFPERDTVLPINKDSSFTEDRTDFRLIENKAGIKGYAGKFYYHAYFRRRDYSYDQNCDTCATRFYAENFLGGDVRFYILDSAFVNVQAEYLLGKDYLLSGTFRSKWFSGGYSRMFQSPSLLQLRYAGNRFNWNNENEFENVSIDNVWARAEVDLKKLYIRPSVNYSIITDLIYFDTMATPKQEGPSVHYASADLFIRINIAKLWLENFTRYATASRILNVPEFFNHSRLYFQSYLFKKALFAQIGFDVYYRSGYNANAYMPVTQQYYLNNSFPVDSYLRSDVFLNVKIKTVSGFVKLSNLAGANYFITPWYPAMPRNFEFGVRWMFFD